MPGTSTSGRDLKRALLYRTGFFMLGGALISPVFVASTRVRTGNVLGLIALSLRVATSVLRAVDGRHIFQKVYGHYARSVLSMYARMY